MDKKIADKLLADSRENYDNFAESFSMTRDYIRPEIRKILERYCKAKDKVLDMGCGNGRYYEFFRDKNIGYIGIDNSSGMIRMARKKFPEVDFRVADALNLPFVANEFDNVVSFSVIHHIPSKDCREKFFQEAWRTLKPNGILIVTAWDLRLFSMASSHQWKRLRSFLKSQIKKILFLERGDFGDFFIPWQNKYQRYVRALTLGELRGLVKNNGFRVVESGILKYKSREADLYIIAKKCEKNNGI